MIYLKKKTNKLYSYLLGRLRLEDCKFKASLGKLVN